MFFPPLLKTLLKNFVLQGVYNGSRAGNNVAGSQTFHAQMLPSERMHMQIALRQTFHANQVYFDGQPWWKPFPRRRTMNTIQSNCKDNGVAVMSLSAWALKVHDISRGNTLERWVYPTIPGRRTERYVKTQACRYESTSCFVSVYQECRMRISSLSNVSYEEFWCNTAPPE